MGVHETHPFDAFREQGIVDEFLKLTGPGSSPLAPSADQLLGVQQKERLKAVEGKFTS